MKLDWKPTNSHGTIWISTCARFVVVSESAKPEFIGSSLDAGSVIEDKPDASLREAALWAQAEANAEEIKS